MIDVGPLFQKIKILLTRCYFFFVRLKIEHIFCYANLFLLGSHRSIYYFFFIIKHQKI